MNFLELHQSRHEGKPFTHLISLVPSQNLLQGLSFLDILLFWMSRDYLYIYIYIYHPRAPSIRMKIKLAICDFDTKTYKH